MLDNITYCVISFRCFYQLVLTNLHHMLALWSYGQSLNGSPIRLNLTQSSAHAYSHSHSQTDFGSSLPTMMMINSTNNQFIHPTGGHHQLVQAQSLNFGRRNWWHESSDVDFGRTFQHPEFQQQQFRTPNCDQTTSSWHVPALIGNWPNVVNSKWMPNGSSSSK